MRSAAANKRRDELPKLLGRKLSILYRIEGDERHPFSEALGLLQKVDDHNGEILLEIRKRNGDKVLVPEADIVSLKVLPTRS